MNRLYLFLLLLLFGVNISFAQYNYDQVSLHALLDSIKMEMKKAHIPGLMLTLVTRDSVLYNNGLGIANLEENRPVDALQRFRLGSVSKSFAALCILKLEYEGKFSLQDKLQDIAPEIPFVNKWEDTHPVRIVHLLEHSAGFDDMHFNAMFNHYKVEPPALDMVKIHRKALVTRWKPGTRMSYSNPDYVILTYLIEKFSGMSYHAYTQQTIFEPLGMQHSDFLSFVPQNKNYAQGYKWTGDAYKEVPFYSVYAGMAGALNSCGNDMAKFVQFFLNNGKVDTAQVFAADLIRKMETPTSTIAAQNGLWTSYALANYPSKFDKAAIFRGHNGGISGFASVYAYNRSLGVGYAMSNNAETGMSKIEDLIINYLVKGVSRVKPAKKPLPEGTIDTFAGYYDLKSPRNQILYFTELITSGVKISFNHDTLLVKGFLTEPQKFIHIGNHLFRNLNNSAPTVLLTKDETGKPILIGGGYFEKAKSDAAGTMRRIWFITSQILLDIFILFGLVWGILSLFKKVSRASTIPTLALWLSTMGLALASVAFILLLQDFTTIGKLNGGTMAVFLGTLLFGIGAVVGLILLLRYFYDIKSGFLKYYLLVSNVAILSLAFFLFQHGWIGLQLWNY